MPIPVFFIHREKRAQQIDVEDDRQHSDEEQDHTKLPKVVLVQSTANFWMPDHERRKVRYQMKRIHRVTKIPFFSRISGYRFLAVKNQRIISK
jgi:hypothetical protein